MEESKKAHTDEDLGEKATDDTPVETPESADEPQKSECDQLRDEIQRLTEELEKAKQEAETSAKEKDDKYLRMAAEYDNFRRRSREEKDAVYETALADTVAELLPILDNLERAAQFEDGEKVREGLAMIAKSTDGVLAKLGVEKFGTPGDKFDPNLHNAVMHEDNEEMGEGEITDVFQKGYKKGNKIIRFAMVKTVN